MGGVLAAARRMSNRLSAASTALAALALVCAPSLAHADGARTVLDLFAGTTISGEYASGERFTEVFDGNGATIYADATTSAQGRVTVEEGRLCFVYPETGDLTGGCFSVERRGDNCFDFYGKDSAANLYQRRNGLGWTARAWRSNLPSTCETPLMS